MFLASMSLWEHPSQTASNDSESAPRMSPLAFFEGPSGESGEVESPIQQTHPRLGSPICAFHAPLLQHVRIPCSPLSRSLAFTASLCWAVVKLVFFTFSPFRCLVALSSEPEKPSVPGFFKFVLSLFHFIQLFINTFLARSLTKRPIG